MTVALLAVAMLGLLAFELWGSKPYLNPLHDMRMLNNGLVMLIAQGRDGACMTVQWPHCDARIEVQKLLTARGAIEVHITDARVEDGRTVLIEDSTSVLNVPAAEFSGEARARASQGATVRKLRHDLEDRAQRLGLDLVPRGAIVFKGILAFNVPRVTGIPRKRKP